MVTLEAILESTNLNQAWKRVVANKGSAGGGWRPSSPLIRAWPRTGAVHKSGEIQTPTRTTSTHSEGGKREIQTTGHPDSD